MSFILDALRKSETDRQQQGSAEFAGVPTSQGREPAPRWLWVLGILLAINVVVLLGLLLKPDAQPQVSQRVQPPVPIQTVPTENNVNDDFAQQVAAARENELPRDESPSAPVEAMPVQDRPVASSAPATINNANALPTIHEVIANGLLTLPEMHVDVHVYSEASADRFVFINMVKHTEGSRLAEGPLVREITRDGVVLEQSGTTFLLPRD